MYAIINFAVKIPVILQYCLFKRIVNTPEHDYLVLFECVFNGNVVVFIKNVSSRRLRANEY